MDGRCCVPIDDEMDAWSVALFFVPAMTSTNKAAEGRARRLSTRSVPAPSVKAIRYRTSTSRARVRVLIQPVLLPGTPRPSPAAAWLV